MMIHIAVFLITLSGLIFEIGLTRIYSATIWYHYAFVAISVALLGWGLGGVALHALRRFLIPTIDKAAVLAMCYAAAIVACLWLIVQFPFRLERLSLYFVAPLVPFVSISRPRWTKRHSLQFLHTAGKFAGICHGEYLARRPWRFGTYRPGRNELPIRRPDLFL